MKARLDDERFVCKFECFRVPPLHARRITEFHR